jgi:hypothetical protein
MAGGFGFQGERGEVGEEIADRWVLLGSEREGESAGLGCFGFGPRVQPGWLLPFSFFLFWFSFLIF